MMASWIGVIMQWSQAESRWVSTRTRSRQRVQEYSVAIPLESKYNLLDTIEGELLFREEQQQQLIGARHEPDTQQGRGEADRAIVIGGSIVSGTDKKFCVHNCDSEMLGCLPGARVQVGCRIFSRGKESSQRLLCILAQMTKLGKGMRYCGVN